MKSVEQMCRELLRQAIDDRLVSAFEANPENRTAGDLCGMANMLEEFAFGGDGTKAKREDAVELPPVECRNCAFGVAEKSATADELFCVKHRRYAARDDSCEKFEVKPEPQCIRCRWWVGDVSMFGLCHRRAPSLVDGEEFIWPETSNTDFCGDFEEKS